MPIEQDQHIVSKVYLEQFSYLHGTQRKVCVRMRGEDFNRNKSIKSFLTAKNIYDLPSTDPNIKKLYEYDLNGKLETNYINVLSEISTKTITDRSEAILKQYISNLFCRAWPQRHEMLSFLNDRQLRNYWIGLFMHALQNDEISHSLNINWNSRSIENLRGFLLSEKPAKILNYAMLLYTMVVSRLVYQLKLIILEAPNTEMQWFTSDNPVILRKNYKNGDKFQILGIDSEIYFPLSPQYLAYLCFDGSDIKSKYRELPHKFTYLVNETEINNITQNYILPNVYKFAISPGPI